MALSSFGSIISGSNMVANAFSSACGSAAGTLEPHRQHAALCFKLIGSLDAKSKTMRHEIPAGSLRSLRRKGDSSPRRSRREWYRHYLTVVLWQCLRRSYVVRCDAVSHSIQGGGDHASSWLKRLVLSVSGCLRGIPLWCGGSLLKLRYEWLLRSSQDD